MRLPLVADPPACFPSAYVGAGRPAHVFVVASCDTPVAEVTVSAPGLRGATIRTSLRTRGHRCAGVGTVTCPGPFAAGRGFRVDARGAARLRPGASIRVVVSFRDGRRDVRRLTLLEEGADDG